MYALMRSLWQRLGSPAPKALILMYHRIAEPACDPWQIAVSAACFEQQLHELRQHWNPVSLPQLIDDIRARRVRDRSVVLTFDDGYADNATVARPLLETYRIPATFFITTQNCEQQHPFWWDELQAILLETPRLPAQLVLPIQDTVFTFGLGDETTLNAALRSRQNQWKATDEPPTRRCRLYYDLWVCLRPLVSTEQQSVVARLRQWAGLPETPVLPVAMTVPQLIDLASRPLFTIGAHTATHPALAEHSQTVCLDEIQTSKHALEQITGTPIDYFAYPYGNYRADTTVLLNSNSFVGAVTTKAGTATHASPLLELPRFQVNNWTVTDFTARLNDWHTRR